MNPTDEQPVNRHKADHLAPWQFKKGQSGNPKGRHPGKSMKEYAKEYLASLTDEERIEYFEGINKVDIWKMAEGNPQSDLTSAGEKILVNLVQFNENDTDSPQPKTE